MLNRQETITPLEATLIIIIAETRAFEFSFDSFRTNLLDPLGADLALCVAESQWEDSRNPFYQLAKYIWTYPEPDDWGSAYDQAQALEGCSGDWRNLLDLDGIWLGGVHRDGSRTRGSGAILLFFRWFLNKSLLESGVLQNYDRFIITRSDFIYTVPHYPIQGLDPDQIWIPEGEDYGGYTDRHIVVSRKDVDSVLGIADPILRSPDELYEKMKNETEWNLERYVRFAFRDAGIDSRVRRFPYTMYAVRSAEGRTSWSQGSFAEGLGYFIKYKNEYLNALLAKDLIKSKENWNPITAYAYFQILGFIDSVREFSRKRLFPLGKSRLSDFLLKLIYGTLLSDKYFASVYPRIGTLYAAYLNTFRKSYVRRKMAKIGYLEQQRRT